MDYNPYLKPWRTAQPNEAAGEGEIERPEHIRNLVWQTRAAPPTEYENQLGDALEQVFEAGAVELAEVVAGLNRLGLRSADGLAWTEATFQAELRRLGA